MTNLHQPHLEPLTGRMVWGRDELANSNDWKVDVSAIQKRELDAAVRATTSLSLSALAGRIDLIPALTDLTRHIRHELDRGRGVVLLRGLDTEPYSLTELKRLYWLLATCVGEPMVQNAVGELLGEVVDRGHDYGSNNVRGYTTSAALGFHCDPADVVALMCVHPARSGGTSHIVCAATIHNEMRRSVPHLLAPLYRGFHFDLRGEGATGDRNEVTNHRVPVFHFHHGRLSMRFNRRTIIDGMKKAGMPLTGVDLEAVNCVADLCARPEFVVDMSFRSGDIQWLSNYDCLHARSAFTDWEDEPRRRRLLRVWLNLNDGRPLREDFSNRFNNGPKQGPSVIEGAGYWAGP